jgi:quinol monooxygenase YgiN
MAKDVRGAASLYSMPGQENAVQIAAPVCVGSMRAEPGNELYGLHRDERNASFYVFFEHWKI